jgi:hypothetical protein
MTFSTAFYSAIATVGTMDSELGSVPDDADKSVSSEFCKRLGTVEQFSCITVAGKKDDV